ncbi:MAG: hypothetical protein E7046_00490 [Lentisphaerae bacterium]|nr:hypothetical protein [Lentisphaerota bacterium]
MILVFVSKNDEEFNRYVRGCGDKKIRRTYSFRPKINDAVAMDAGTWIPQMPSLSAAFGDMESRVAAEHRGAQQQINLEDSGTEYVFPLESMSEYHTSGVFVVAIRSSSDINKLKADSKNSGYRGLSTKKLLSLIADIVRETFPDEKSEVSKQDIHLLVHWGSVKYLSEEEKKFNDVISQEHYEREFPCKSLRFYELSSRRRDCLNVEEQAIKIPYKKKDVETLFRRLGSFEKYAEIKDHMTKYVLAETGLEVDTELIRAFLSESEFRKKLRSVVSEVRLKWLLEWNLFKSFMDAESTEKIKGAVEQMVTPFDRCDKDKARAFISQLLSEGLVR